MARVLLLVAQAGVYGVLAWALAERWIGDAALLGVAGLVQLAATRLPAPRERVAHLATLGCVFVVWGRFAATTLHVVRVFGPLAADQATQLLATSLVALPWVCAFPLARLFLLPRPGGPQRVALLLPLAGLLPAAEGLRPYASLPGADGVEALAISAWAGWAERRPTDARLPTGAVARITPVRAGVPGTPRRLDGPADLDGALPDAPPGPRDALIVDVAEEALPAGLLVPGRDGPEDGPSPGILARRDTRRRVLPNRFLPSADAPTYRWRTVLVSEAGVVPLVRGWSAGPALSASAIDAALGAAVQHLVHGLGTDGRFTYIVEGPSGAPGRGYNYPRHAGTAWFLARAWAATGDAAARDAAGRALAHLARTTGRSEDGRAWVRDPDRTDGRTWIGTTALAALAHARLLADRAAAAPPEGADRALLVAYLRQVAASVDATGQVRGEMTLADGAFPDQPVNAYGQGQAMLALAAGERVGIDVGAAALDRAIGFVEGGGYLGTARPLAVGDEHWTCLAASAIREVRGVDAGAGICDAYVAGERRAAPVPGSGLVPALGPGAGAAEALAARAWDTGRDGLRAATLAWAQAFLDAQYRPADAPLLGRPDALLGGFRDGPDALDVQIDAVQHIGGALLGAEALLSGRARPGSLP